jgi:hypothetical protein
VLDRPGTALSAAAQLAQAGVEPTSNGNGGIGVTIALLEEVPVASLVLRPDLVIELSERPADVATTDIVEEWGMQSFPASDPPANW